MLAAGDDWFDEDGREVTYEYVVLGGENDSTAHARALASACAAALHRLNLIPFQSGRR
jgi:23S rRNA (adenine2503-C2)-methyltransferase